MKQIIILLIGIAVTINGHAQYLDTEQPDSLYKLHKVKKRVARYERYGLANCNVNEYDQNGKLIKRTMMDKSGKRKWLETFFQYDPNAKLIKAISNVYMNSDPLTGAEKPDSVLDSSKICITIFEYDHNGRLVKTQGTTLVDKRPVVSIYSYEPLKVVSTFHRLNDSLPTTNIITYETPHISKIDFGSYDPGIVTKNYWEDDYENTFDKDGKILKRIKTNPNDPSFYISTTYEYNSDGLLVKKTDKSCHCHSVSCEWSIFFDYEYLETKEPDNYVTVKNNITAVRAPGK